MNKTNKAKISEVCRSLLASSRWNPKLSNKARKVVRGDCIVPKPSSKVPWVSIEIECFFKSLNVSWGMLASALDKFGLSDYVRLHEDCSIDASGPHDESYTTAEVVVTAPETKILKVLEEVCFVLKSFKASTNDSCGLHIHVDHRPQVKRSSLISYNNLYYAEDLLFKLSKPYRRNCEYCQSVKSDNAFQSLKDCYECDPLSVQDVRYRSINTEAIDAHRTLEIRIFHSTINFEEIKHFVNLVLGVVNSKTPIVNHLNARNIDSCKSIPLPTRKFIKSKRNFYSKRKAA